MLIKNQINEKPVVMLFIDFGRTERSSPQCDDALYVADISQFIERKASAHPNSLTR